MVHIGQPDAAPALGAGQHSAARTADEDLSRLDGDRHLEPFDLHVQDVDMVETDQELAHARRVRSHGGSPVFRRQEPSDWQGPRLISGIQDPPHPRRASKSEFDGMTGSKVLLTGHRFDGCQSNLLEITS